MSAHDPYAPPEPKPSVEEAAASVEAPVEAPKAPQTEELTVPEGSIKDVLNWVSDDPAKAQTALDAENAGEKRKTLLKELNAIITK